MLDQADPHWRGRLIAGSGFDQLLLAADKVTLPTALDTTAKMQALRYDPDGVLRTAEITRDAARRMRIASLKAKLVDGPVLVAPLKQADVEFKPSTLQPVGDYGVAYPTARVSAPWGVLEVSRDALLDKEWNTVAVSAAHVAVGGLVGDGWTLKLTPGWAVVSGARPGDLKIAEEKPAP